MGTNEYRSNLKTLLYVILRRLWLILIISVAAAVATALVTIYLIPPVYSSQAKFYVYNDSSKSSTSISSQDINAAQSLVGTYIVIIKSNSVMEKVADIAGVSYTPGQLLSKITAGSLSGTEAFYVTVSGTDKEENVRIANAIVQVVPETIPDVVKAGGVSVIDYPQIPTSQDGPNVKINTIISFFVAFVIAFAVVFLREITDNKIYCEEDIKGLFNYPIIGQIPEITVNSADNQMGYGKKIKETKRKD